MVEDQTREHLNELDMCNSSGSDGMLPEANQCRCEDTVKYSWKAEVTRGDTSELEERKCLSYLQEMQSVQMQSATDWSVSSW